MTLLLSWLVRRHPSSPLARFVEARASQLRDPRDERPASPLRDLLDRRAGRVDEVLAAYNASTSWLTRWKNLTASDAPDVLLERIPYRETRDYVRAVQEDAVMYKALYWTVDPGS